MARPIAAARSLALIFGSLAALLWFAGPRHGPAGALGAGVAPRAAAQDRARTSALVPAPGSAAPFHAATHAAYIRSAQRSSGAIAMVPGGQDINPYFANIAAQALLVQPQGQLPAVQAWMDWYVAHLNPDGSIDDHRVADGGREVATGRYDSADSYAATFLSLVGAYLRAGGDPAWISRHRPALDRVVGLVDALTDGDGLVWAKPYYPLKLLMDNAEVYRGWTDWAQVLDRLGDRQGAAAARYRAGRLRQGLERFRLPDGTYAWAVGPLGLRRGGQLQRFYPDGVAQFFPLAMGVTRNPSGWRRFAAAHPDWYRLQSDPFPWLMSAYAAQQAGDRRAARLALRHAADRYGNLAYPWYIAESAWTLRVLAGRG